MSSVETTQARFTYRLRVSRAGRQEIEGQWNRCRWVWNQCVAESRKAFIGRIECGPAKLDRMLTGWRVEHDWLREGASVPQQQTIRDFAAARAKALKDIKAKLPVRQRAGLPRFKKKCRARPSLNYTRRGFRIKDGRLWLAGGISLAVVWSRGLPSQPSSVRVFRDVLGHWYASFVVETRVIPLPDTGRVIGVDWGVRELATTTSDAHDLPHPEHGKSAQRRLARYQRMMARRKPERGQTTTSRGYRTAKQQAAKAYAKVARQRTDTARKWAKHVVSDHDALAVEDFKPKFLARSTMARKATDAAIATTKAVLIHMARKHTRILHLVNPAHTTMDCGKCVARTTHALPLSQRTYFCAECGHVTPRDKNSAHVMLIRAGLAPAGADRVRPVPPLAGRAA